MENMTIERLLGVIEAVSAYRREAVRTVLQQESQGWSFFYRAEGDEIDFVAVAPDGCMWALQRNPEGNWATCPESRRSSFERAWGGSLSEAWQQRLLDAAVVIFNED